MYYLSLQFLFNNKAELSNKRMKLNNARIIILLVIIIININENLAQNLSFNNLSIGDGLSDPIVNEIIQDNDGYLWFCIQRGLNRYDGQTYRR